MKLSSVRRLFQAVAITVVLVCTMALAGRAAGPTRRIHFRPGQTLARVHGHLANIHDQANFVLHARAGQHMRIKITGTGPTRGVVRFPSGKQDGGPGGVVFDDDLTETGDYHIRVTESTMAQQWRGPFTLEVRLH